MDPTPTAMPMGTAGEMSEAFDIVLVLYNGLRVLK
jgi:hypothetical protein